MKNSKHNGENPEDKIKLKTFKELESEEFSDIKLENFKKSMLDEFHNKELEDFKNYLDDSKTRRSIENLRTMLNSNEAIKNILKELNDIGLDGTISLYILEMLKKQ